METQFINIMNNRIFHFIKSAIIFRHRAGRVVTMIDMFTTVTIHGKYLAGENFDKPYR